MGLKSLLQKYSRSDRQIIINRFPKGDYKSGVFTTSGVATKIQVWASVQPVQTDFHPDVSPTPGGVVRSGEALKVFTEIEILVDKPGQRADRVEVDGVMYEARSQGKYGHKTLGHFETIIVKVADK